VEGVNTTENQDFHVVCVKRVVLIKDNLTKRNWNGSKQCSLCCKDESLQPMFFDCYYARFL
jgi:hypothetical protein